MVKQWFVVRVPTNMEDRVRESVLNRVKTHNLEHRISQVVVAQVTEQEIRAGKKKLVQRKIFPGYVLLEADLYDGEGKLDRDLWFFIKETPRLGDFVGSDQNPQPMAQSEVERILGGMKSTEEKPRVNIPCNVGDRVKIKEGPFENFTGVVDDVNVEKMLVRVIVTIFGRETPVELEVSQVELV
ncbi:MAG: transcription termination/antitermination factor NusG [Planctomycetes bacterium]|nr:transcription termination/antitermination factor NusG [Planctomycetota bacterium]